MTEDASLIVLSTKYNQSISIYERNNASISLIQQMSVSDYYNFCELSGNGLWLFCFESIIYYTGSVTIYQRSTSSGQFTLFQTISDPRQQSYDNFGSSITFSQDNSMVCIGASGEQTNGAIFIYFFNSQQNQWVQHQKITPPKSYTGTSLPFFGGSVSLGGSDGSLIVAGVLEGLGSVLIYEKQASTQQWVYTGAINYPDGSSYDNDPEFGTVVCASLDKSIIVISAPNAILHHDYWNGLIFVYQQQSPNNPTYTLIETISHPNVQSDYTGTYFGFVLQCPNNLDKFIAETGNYFPLGGPISADRVAATLYVDE